MNLKNKLQNIVEGFQKTFGHPHNTKPTLPELDRFVNRKGWGAIEESVEQIHTLSKNMDEFDLAVARLHTYVNLAADKQRKKDFLTDETEKLAALADGLGDELWFLLGDCVEAGIDIEPIIEIIQDSNNSKLFVDEEGNLYPKENDKGKIIKSPRFFAPEPYIEEEIKKQIKG